MFLHKRARALIIGAAGLTAAGVAEPAFADPCEAIPERGAPPAWVKPGARFSGAVRYVVDGDGLCVGRSAVPRTWIEVRLADFYAPELNEPGGREAKAALSRIAAGRQVVCEAVRRGRVRSYDRVVAVCWVGDRRLSELLAKAGVKEGGRAAPQ